MFAGPSGATPILLDDARGLRQNWIATRGELNEAEQANILSAMAWLQRARVREGLTEAFVLELHKRMFGEVWNWAGSYRERQTNIGVHPGRIRIDLKELIDDANHWITAKAWPPDELAVRLHHRMVWIHPFPNGNGRHTRLLADVIVQYLGRPPFTWGSADLNTRGDIRDTYIAALQRADNHDIAHLIAFARS